MCECCYTPTSASTSSFYMFKHLQFGTSAYSQDKINVAFLRQKFHKWVSETQTCLIVHSMGGASAPWLTIFKSLIELMLSSNWRVMLRLTVFETFEDKWPKFRPIVHDINELKWRTEYAISDAWLGAKCDQWRNKWVVQLTPCVYFCQRRTFKHLIWLKTTVMLNFSFLVLWALKVNYCNNCVKYVRFLLFLIFCILQGNVHNIFTVLWEV